MCRKTQARGTHRRKWWGILFSCLAFALDAVATPLFPPNSTVVLVSGLAGDSESESLFHEQLGTWLALAEGAGRVTRIYVLADAPGSVSRAADARIGILSSTREEFLKLGPLLSRERGPVVVVAFGHGGQQGSTPVFHVRGPRLTPADFLAFATQFNRPSQWILIFRGSGRFAAELAAKDRLVFSSDADTIFESDPVANSILLKLARVAGSGSFEELVQEAGTATASWYAERHLARTEEPALWAGGDPPKLLGTGGAGISEPGTPPNPSVGEPRTSPRSSAAKVPVLPALPAGWWKDVKRVELSSYPGCDGVVLRRHIQCMLGSRPALVTEQDELIQVFTPEGKELGDFDVAYAPPSEELEFLDCEILAPDGTVTRLDPDTIGETEEPGIGDYHGPQRKVLSLPGVVPGCVLHVRYRTQWMEFPLPRISLELPLGHDLPIVEEQVQISVPRQAPLHFAFLESPAPDPSVTQSAYSTSYTWKLGGIPPLSREVLARPHSQPRLLVSTFADWNSFAQWYGRISRLADEITPEIQAKALELTRSCRSGREKVRALYNFVTTLRYVAVPLGVNSFRPHAAANVLRNQFGDCKDKANLFNALLRAIHIEANLVLVPRFAQASEEVPGLAFNHAISRVTLDGAPMWVDTTDDVCPFGLLPPGDPGRNVLVIDGKTAALSRLPAPLAREHRLEIRGQVDCSTRNKGIQMKITAAGTGYPDYELRSAAREAKERRTSMPLLACRFQPAAGCFAMERQRATPLSDLGQKFSWEGEGICLGLGSFSSKEVRLHSPFWMPREWELAVQGRQAPLFLNTGYPLMLDENFEIALPAGSRPVVLPPVNENGKEPLRWRIEWTRIGDDKVAARFHAELERGELSAADTTAIQTQLRGVLAAFGADALFSRSN